MSCNQIQLDQTLALLMLRSINIYTTYRCHYLTSLSHMLTFFYSLIHIYPSIHDKCIKFNVRRWKKNHQGTFFLLDVVLLLKYIHLKGVSKEHILWCIVIFWATQFYLCIITFVFHCIIWAYFYIDCSHNLWLI